MDKKVLVNRIIKFVINLHALLSFVLPVNLSAEQEHISDTLTLQTCFDLGKKNNASLAQALARLEETRGEKVISRSRLLPHISLLYNRGRNTLIDTSNNSSVSDDMVINDEQFEIELRQRIVEFGKTNSSEFERRLNERNALYAYEDEITEILSEIRKTYFSLQIIQQQLDSHDSLLNYYSEQLEHASSRLAKGITLKTRVLTARLNRLEEKERILSLDAQQREKKVYLKTLLGINHIGSNVSFQTPAEAFPLDEDSSVITALKRSTAITDAEFRTLIAKERLKQWGWEFFPDINLSAGVYKDGHHAELEVGTSPKQGSNRTWSLDLVGTETFSEANGAIFVPHDSTLKFTAKIELDFPLLKGLRRKGTRIELAARYNEARAHLVEETRNMEHNSRTAFYQYHLAAQNLTLQKERVEIAQERYEIAETLYELGKMSEDGLDSFRERFFRAHDLYFAQQFKVLDAEEHLRKLVRQF